MIEGELYVLIRNPKYVFAYKGKIGALIYHYACVTSTNEARIPGIAPCVGVFNNQLTRIANYEERSRFYEYLHESGYHYNIANRKVINIITGRLV